MKRTFTFLTIVLLAVYALYAVSPLSYDTACSTCGDTLGSPAQAIKLFAVDTVLGALLSQNAQDDDDDPASASTHDHILLKKKRALRTASVAKLIAQLSTRSESRLGIPSVHECMALAAPLYDAATHCPYGYSFLHSGTSPPSV